jgi:hypothetical protein
VYARPPRLAPSSSSFSYHYYYQSLLHVTFQRRRHLCLHILVRHYRLQVLSHLRHLHLRFLLPRHLCFCRFLLHHHLLRRLLLRHLLRFLLLRRRHYRRSPLPRLPHHALRLLRLPVPDHLLRPPHRHSRSECPPRIRLYHRFPPPPPRHSTLLPHLPPYLPHRHCHRYHHRYHQDYLDFERGPYHYHLLYRIQRSHILLPDPHLHCSPHLAILLPPPPLLLLQLLFSHVPRSVLEQASFVSVLVFVQRSSSPELAPNEVALLDVNVRRFCHCHCRT